MKEKLEQLEKLLHEIHDLSAANAVLEWDQQVNMPRGAAEDRGEQMATLSRIAHIKSTSDELGKLLDDLTKEAASLAKDSDEARLIKVAKRRYDKDTKVSGDWVAEFTKATAVAQSTWEEAKVNDDFELFRPHLEKLVGLRQEYAEFFKPYDHVYDPLLDDFEPGMKTAEVQKIFADMKDEQVELIHQISQQPEIDNSFLFLKYDADGQIEFGKKVITDFGYDWNHGRQDISVHPFTTSFGLNDVRITTKIVPDFLSPCLFGTFHECGHALYEQGIAKKFNRTPIADGASMAIHESQSRMWENLIGRSEPFWKRYYKDLQKIFPSQLGNIDGSTFYKGINKVEPSLIRIEADEATYNLHIMLRLEMEIGLMEGSIQAKDAAQVWKEKFNAYLGIVPPNDRQGVLQDVHWSSGLFGYFPTYALGNLVSVQLWDRMLQDNPDTAEQVEAGEFSKILGWYREHVHQYGAKYEPQELVQKITGEKINSAPFTRYLKDKFGKIYNL
ncbi:MAG TPA: carboxypeptidase [Anaerolineaceae bacterium]|uniref:Metal-dependent carboxypeptidase n=1 Tax=Anaerolinea thermophila TaxID=167964 RepID=A0A101FYR6_9CHLR|nr:MAG: Carboxypeptidase Taq [Anaerolinea thermophila]HAF61718.1 carboxypeptidase [Anaerolineaceae bacterium]